MSRPRVISVVALAFAGAAAVWIIRARDRDKQVMWSLYADMHNMAVSEVAYYMDRSTFSTDISDRYSPTHGATVRITTASDTSWAALATHPATAKVCSMTYAEPRRATRAQVGAARVAAMQSFSCK